MKAGFIGLGHLGRAMAGRLVSQGVDLILWNRTTKKAADFAREHGCRVAETPATLAVDSSVIILNLFDSSAVKSVLAGPGGLLEGDLSGRLLIDTTTNHFRDVIEFHRLVSSRGGLYLEAPVLGSVVPASRGELTVLASGVEHAFEMALPYLQNLATNIFYLQEEGLASRMKLVNNLVLGSFMATIAEAVAFGEAAGLDRDRVLEILASGAGNSGVLNAKREKLACQDFSPHFQSSLIYKDMHYLQDLAYELKRPLFMGSAVKELYGMTYARGEEMLDFSAIYTVLKDLQRRQ